jgi:hypothetical protein
MRVDPSNNAQSPIALTQAEAAAPRTANRTAGSPASPVGTGSFAMTDQLTQLLSAVRNAPDVRPDAVASASAKLASGELDTPQAATDTANAMLQDAIPPSP